ncbi:MAG: hypothetical protein EZS28_050635, partial [Streblomastix strix]
MIALAETQEVGRIPDSVIPADGKVQASLLLTKRVNTNGFSLCIFSKIKQLVQKVGKSLQWANDNVYKRFIKPFAKPILGALGHIGQTIVKVV